MTKAIPPVTIAVFPLRFSTSKGVLQSTGPACVYPCILDAVVNRKAAWNMDGMLNRIIQPSLYIFRVQYAMRDAYIEPKIQFLW